MEDEENSFLGDLGDIFKTGLARVVDAEINEEYSLNHTTDRYEQNAQGEVLRTGEPNVVGGLDLRNPLVIGGAVAVLLLGAYVVMK